jgi:hypothetical protein
MCWLTKSCMQYKVCPIFCGTPVGSMCLAGEVRCRFVREGVSTDSLKFHPALPCPTLLRPAGGLQPSSSPLDTPSRTGLNRTLHLLHPIAFSTFNFIFTPKSTRLVNDRLLSYHHHAPRLLSSFMPVFNGVSSIGIRRGVSKRLHRKPSTLQTGHP